MAHHDHGDVRSVDVDSMTRKRGLSLAAYGGILLTETTTKSDDFRK